MKDYCDWDFLNRDFSEEERRRLAKSGAAMPDGSFPIVTKDDLANAVQAIGRAKNPDAAKRHIIKRARALGAEEMLPESWEVGEKPDPDDMSDWTPKRPKARLSKDWYRIENKAETGGADVFIYDEVGGFGVSANDFLAEVRNLSGPMNLHLNSPGGDVFDGLTIYQALKARSEPTTVHVDGLAASIASVIAMGADKVVMAPKATLMIHDGWTAAAGNAQDFRKLVDLLDKTSTNIASVYADKAGGTVDFWRDRMKEETWYSAEEALEAGLVDEVQGKARKAEFDTAMFAHAGRDDAPAPVLKPVELKGEHGPEVLDLPTPESPAVEPKKDEPAPFTWDFAAFRSALQEGVK